MKRAWSCCRPEVCGGRPAFVTLSHPSRTFHPKTTPILPLLENFRAATTTANPAPLVLLDLRTAKDASTFTRRGCRHYSQSFTLPDMAEEVHWTGPRVRQAFLDFFAERGHTVGRPTPRWRPTDGRFAPVTAQETQAWRSSPSSTCPDAACDGIFICQWLASC